MNSDFTFYLSRYSFEILASLPYFAGVSLFGLFLILRRSSLFGVVLSQSAQLSFLIGAALHFQTHSGAFDLINRTSSRNLSVELFHLDLYVLPISVLFLLPFLYLSRKSLKNAESTLLVLFVILAGSMPLVYKILGGNDSTLLKVYFSEILYTPPDMFLFYLPHIFLSCVLLFIFYPGILLSGYDPIQARLSGYSVSRYNYLYYFLTLIILSSSIKVLGIYVSIAAMLAPAMAALSFTRSMRSTIVLTISFSLLLAIGGFATAFIFDNYPAEPIIILVITLGSFIVRFTVISISKFKNIQSRLG